jgi:hypothetical protein
MNATDARHTKRKQDNNVAEIKSLIKIPKVVPSILKGVAAPRKPRVGDDFQVAVLPCPPRSEALESAPRTQPRSDPPGRPSSATTISTAIEEQISQPQLEQIHD